MTLLAGAGRSVITPELGTLLFGYRGDIPGLEVRDGLTVTAAAFDSGGTRAMIISASLCLINTGLADTIRNLTGAAADIPPANIILAATHTHSGPSTQDYEGWGTINRDYCDKILIPGCVAAAKTAAVSMRPVLAGITRGESRAGINRREFTREGGIKLGQNPWGAFDPAMTVVAFRATDGTPVVNIVHYGAHCTAAGCNHTITRDWAGVMTDRLEEETGAFTMFLNGAQGDIGPRMSSGLAVGGPGFVEEIGRLAADDAIRIYHSINDYKNADCSVIQGEISLSYQPLMPLEQAREALAKFTSPPEHNIGRRIYTTLHEIVDMHRRGDTGEDDFTMRQTFIRVSDVVFAPLPFEAFSEISLRLRKFSPFEHTLLVGCANGDNSYLPTQDQLCRGGYEIDMFRWSRPRRLPDDADSRIVDQYLRIMEGMI